MWLDSVGRWLNDAREPGAREAGLFLADFGFDLLSRQDKRDEDGLAATVGGGWSAGQTVAAVDQFFDGKQFRDTLPLSLEIYWNQELSLQPSAFSHQPSGKPL
jgi:hypothetical protein